MEPQNNNNAAATANESTYQSIADFILNSKTLLTNALLPDILPKLQVRGITQEHINALQTDMDLLASLNEAQRKEYGEQHQATAAWDAAKKTAHEPYMDLLTLARLVFKKNVGAKTTLSLSGKRKVSKSGYLRQAMIFYKNLLDSADYLEAMGKKGVTVQEVEEARNAMQLLEPLDAAQQKETGEAQMATKQRDALYDDLDESLYDLRETSKVALRKYPQMREQLGIKEVS